MIAISLTKRHGPSDIFGDRRRSTGRAVAWIGFESKGALFWSKG